MQGPELLVVGSRTRGDDEPRLRILSHEQADVLRPSGTRDLIQAIQEHRAGGQQCLDLTLLDLRPHLTVEAGPYK